RSRCLRPTGRLHLLQGCLSIRRAHGAAWRRSKLYPTKSENITRASSRIACISEEGI
ncbi:MAG: hypothetical protein HWN66_20755, partial [Candidatus Helarchaeota archaeon]|nr:hypothetical protein [Candidatus Helarchaeota archaeon]